MSENEMSTEQLRALVRGLATRLEKVEAELAAIRADKEVTEDVVLAISAAVSAYLGHRAKVRAVRFHRQGAWTAQGRSSVQSRAVPHIR